MILMEQTQIAKIFVVLVTVFQMEFNERVQSFCQSEKVKLISLPGSTFKQML